MHILSDLRRPSTLRLSLPSLRPSSPSLRLPSPPLRSPIFASPSVAMHHWCIISIIYLLIWRLFKNIGPVSITFYIHNILSIQTTVRIISLVCKQLHLAIFNACCKVGRTSKIDSGAYWSIWLCGAYGYVSRETSFGLRVELKLDVLASSV